jgi:hypothetical protein
MTHFYAWSLNPFAAEKVEQWKVFETSFEQEKGSKWGQKDGCQKNGNGGSSIRYLTSGFLMRGRCEGKLGEI